MNTIKAWPLKNQLAGYFKMSKKCLPRILVIEIFTTGYLAAVGQITFTETGALSVFFWIFTWNEPVVDGSALVVGIRGLCMIAKNGLDIE